MRTFLVKDRLAVEFGDNDGNDYVLMTNELRTGGEKIRVIDVKPDKNN